jgi:hypothetical protein
MVRKSHQNPKPTIAQSSQQYPVAATLDRLTYVENVFFDIWFHMNDMIWAGLGGVEEVPEPWGHPIPILASSCPLKKFAS